MCTNKRERERMTEREREGERVEHMNGLLLRQSFQLQNMTVVRIRKGRLGGRKRMHKKTKGVRERERERERERVKATGRKEREREPSRTLSLR